MEQRVTDRARCMDARTDVAHRHHRHIRRPVLLTNQGRYARISLADEIESRVFRERPRLSEGGNRTHYDLWIQRLDVFIAEAHAPDYARRKIFHQHVDLRNQCFYDLDALGLPQVDANALLAAVLLHEIGAALVAHVRDQTSLVAVRRSFDLDNLGAHLGHEPCYSRSRNVVREIENLVAIQHVLGHALRHRLFLNWLPLTVFRAYAEYTVPRL